MQNAADLIYQFSGDVLVDNNVACLSSLLTNQMHER
jgi:hypothetical protein